jgi:uncharacterized phage infection (PIP) family protein YhgE
MKSDSVLRLCFIIVTAFSIGTAVSQEAVENTNRSADEQAAQEQTDRASSQKPSKRPAKSVQELMTPDEFKAAGLDKLSEDELQHLDAWLQGYRQTAEKRVSEQVEKKATEEIKKANEQAKVRAPRVLVERVVSRVDGTLGGLTGSTVIKLEDGTVWKQANHDDRYQPVVTDHPMVSVSHSPFGYKMRVEGMPEFYVNPIRSN